MKRVLSLCLGIIVIFGAISSMQISSWASCLEEEDQLPLHVISKDMQTNEITERFYTPASNSNLGGTMPNTSFRQVVSLCEEISPSELEVTANALSDEINGILGSDDRTKVTNTAPFPYSAVCYIEAYVGSSLSISTAFMVGDNIAVTAGHSVYKNGQMASSVTVYPAKNGYWFWNNTYGTAQSVHVVAPAWDDDENPNADWAIIQLNQNIGNSTGWFGITWEHGDALNRSFTLSGYPGSDQYYQYTHTGNIVGLDEYFIYHNMDATAGQSGSPIYNSDGVVYGIHAYTAGLHYNQGTRINKSVYLYMVDFINTH